MAPTRLHLDSVSAQLDYVSITFIQAYRALISPSHHVGFRVDYVVRQTNEVEAET